MFGNILNTTYVIPFNTSKLCKISEIEPPTLWETDRDVKQLAQSHK